MDVYCRQNATVSQINNTGGRSISGVLEPDGLNVCDGRNMAAVKYDISSYACQEDRCAGKEDQYGFDHSPLCFFAQQGPQYRRAQTP